MNKGYHNSSTFRRGLMLLLTFIGMILVTNCDNSAVNTPKGLTIDNLCFSLDGGNISNNLRADEAWSIQIAGNDPWASVTPSSGTGSTSLIPLIFTVNVNNNSQSRSAIMTITIGNEAIKYILNQDGTSQQICNN